ncbi:DUF5343 domain-containing protein [Mucilaginibacter litoreus]|uniref:DUF5343 domain-containing protein n=1 Tax=Mucilaginibacter litoreus TaxID=1048221 RepID=A0ABW3AT81_9SPHI
MSTNLPYIPTPGVLPKILNKICEATVPESFNADFLGTKLGFPGGNQRAFISWAKKCTFLNSDGTPTQLYKDFRNPNYRGTAMAEALKKGYSEIYVRNEYAQDLSRAELTKVVSEITGSPHDNSTVKVIVGTYIFAKEFADFETKKENVAVKEEQIKQERTLPDDSTKTIKKLNLGLSYTINLVLPKTDDPAIYSAIFKSLKENLLDD